MSTEEVAFSPDLTVKSAATPDFLLENLAETWICWEDRADKEEEEDGPGGLPSHGNLTTHNPASVFNPTSTEALEKVHVVVSSGV